MVGLEQYIHNQEAARDDLLRAPHQVPFWEPDDPSPRPPCDSTHVAGTLGLSHDPDITAQLRTFSLGTHVPLVPITAAPIKQHSQLSPVLQQFPTPALSPLVQPSQLLFQPTPSGPAITAGLQQLGLAAPFLASLQMAH